MILDLQKVAFRSHTPQTNEPSVVHCQRDHEKGDVCWLREDLEKTKYFRKVLDCWCVRRRGVKRKIRMMVDI